MGFDHARKFGMRTYAKYRGLQIYFKILGQTSTVVPRKMHDFAVRHAGTTARGRRGRDRSLRIQQSSVESGKKGRLPGIRLQVADEQANRRAMNVLRPGPLSIIVHDSRLTACLRIWSECDDTEQSKSPGTYDAVQHHEPETVYERCVDYRTGWIGTYKSGATLHEMRDMT